MDRRLAPRVVGAHLHEPLGGGAVELDLVDRLARRRPRAARAAGPPSARSAARAPRAPRRRRGGGWPRRSRRCRSRPPDARSPSPFRARRSPPSARRSRTPPRCPPAAASVSAIGAFREPGEVTAWRHPAAAELVHEDLERRVGAVDRDHGGAMVLFIPGFMQRGDAWRPVAELLPERYPSTLLDHAEHTFEGRMREIADPGPPCWWATRSAGAWPSARRSAHQSPSRAVVLVGATAGIEEGPLRSDTGRGRREARLVDGGDADRGHRRALGAPAAVRRPVRRARGGAAPRPPLARPAPARADPANRGPGRARPRLA